MRLGPVMHAMDAVATKAIDPHVVVRDLRGNHAMSPTNARFMPCQRNRMDIRVVEDLESGMQLVPDTIRPIRGLQLALSPS